MRSSCPWILVLALVGCGQDSGSSGLVVQISVPDFGSWESNRPIEFDFDQPIDFASVSARSVEIRSAGAPAAGTFEAGTIDADGDGVPEGTDESVVVFYPRCALAPDLSDAGLVPGTRYVIRLPGADSGADPASLLRTVSGGVLARTVVSAFETIADPESTLHDEKPGVPPQPVLGGQGCHLELGEDPAQRVFFEPGPVPGRPPAGFAAPLDLYADRATRVAFVLVFDQFLRPSPANLARLRLEYSSALARSGWRALESRVELVSNCGPGKAVVRLSPLGTFPPGGSVRATIEAGFEDVAGEATLAPLDGFVLTPVATVAFTSLDPQGAIADGIREEFDFPAGSPLSLAAPPEPPGATVPALWGQGELRADFALVHNPPELREFDFVVRSGTVFVFDTSATTIEGGPGGLGLMTQD